MSLTTQQIFKNSSGDLSGDIFLLTNRGSFLLDDEDLYKPSYQFSSHVKINGKETVIPPHPLTMHGYAWDYDIKIPLVFHDPNGRYIKKGIYERPAIQQDIASTVAELLSIAPPSRANGRILTEILAKNRRPKVIVVFALDQVGRNYFAHHKSEFSFLNQLAKDGAFFSNAQVAHVDVETVVGHVAIGSGAFPGNSGVAGNNFFNPGLNLATKIFSLEVSDQYKSGAVPLQYFAPTVGDQWMYVTQGKAINYAISSAARAAIGMGGHGRLYRGKFPSHVIYLDDLNDAVGSFVSDTNFYSIPESAAKKNFKTYYDKFYSENKGSYFGHTLLESNGKPNERLILATPILSSLQKDTTLDVIDELKIGKDAVTDLLWINVKATDYCGHIFGHESLECGPVAKAADDEVRAIYNRLQAVTGGDFVIAFTADHGVAPLPELTGGMRFSRQKLTKDLNDKFGEFGPGGEVVLQLTSSQLYLNKPLLKRFGHSVNDVVKYLKSYEIERSAPGNVLAEQWNKKGKKMKLFREVVARDSLR